MDIKSYIDSGILEQFVLGNTSPEETEEIIEFSKSYPEIKAEIEAIEDALLNYAKSHALEPSSNVKEKIMNSLGFDELSENDSQINNERELTPKPTFNAIKFIPNQKLFIAASLVLLGMSVIINIWLYNNWKNSKNQLAALSSENTLLTNNDKVQEAKYSDLENKMNVLFDADVKPVELKGLTLMPNAIATVYWNKNKGEVFLNVSNLAESTEEEQYQLWAIVDGKPQDAGVFNARDAIKGIVKMKDAARVSAFAVTIEKRGGSINPSLEKMVLIGEVI